ncbi:hypothetical protein D3C87_1639810 [compost metagenome]
MAEHFLVFDFKLQSCRLGSLTRHGFSFSDKRRHLVVRRCAQRYPDLAIARSDADCRLSDRRMGDGGADEIAFRYRARR